MREIGRGDKVFDAPVVTGRLRLMEGPADVLALLDDPAEDVIAVVRDAGATFLGPLFGELAGVICTAGTLRSHIGIVSREFGVPAIMGAELADVAVTGLVVELDCSGEIGIVRG